MFTNIFVTEYKEPIVGKLHTLAYYYLMCLSLDLLHALIWLIYLNLFFFPLSEGSVYSIL